MTHAARRHHVRFGRYRLHLPGSRLLRVGLGIALCIGGMLGFLPVLGFWMIPLGMLVLAVDWHHARRINRKATVWWGRRNGRKKA